ncbi:rare lipoprotein A [Nitrosomonas marina]|uniref:Endolytic peptidoglycan transglycosylase RlpA n=1 Tax=Nitrosomonas marina TaxID=917 RepID=A0A1H9Y719_9PROT|nr:septal ring lytic transglycosylase RlpA family protein [Nitrosomonas marina]SES64554.1 rare lipoprotein A [Nitrosomonas marina]
MMSKIHFQKIFTQFIRLRFPSFSTLFVKIIVPAVLLSISGCASTSQYNAYNGGDISDTSPVQQHIAKQSEGGGYYLDDGPGENPPDDLHLIPNAIPKLEPLREANMRPYEVMGQTFEPMTTLEEYNAQGTASWYGRRYHGNQTASGEVYDMYAMTAAHPTLPLPSYARVTNVENGKTVIVRINDRGPFLSDRLIDLSYTAAYKLDIIENGSGEVIVESILPKEIKRLASTDTRTSRSNEKPRSETGAYLQLGAFGNADNAQTYLSHIQTRIPWLRKVTGITKQNGLFKVHAGPYASHVLARQAANTITQRLAIRPLIVVD